MASTELRKIVTAVAVCLCFGAVSAHAHDRLPTRQVMVQVDSAGLVALWGIQVAGPRAQMLWAVYDVNRNGKLDGAERKTAAAALVSKAVDGVSVRWNDAPIRLKRLTPRLEKADPTGALVASAVGEVVQSEPLGASGQLHVRVADTSGPIAVHVQALRGWRIHKSNLGHVAATGMRFLEPVFVNAGRELRVRLGRKPATR